MENYVDAEIVDAIWNLLNEPFVASRNHGVRNAHLSVLEEGWGLSYEIEDILSETDARAEKLLYKEPKVKEFLCKQYDLHKVTRYKGPFATKKEVYGYPAMRAEDIATLVIAIERLGFSVDAEPLVAALSPGLIRNKHLTSSELSVVWYKKQRHKSNPVILHVRDESADTFQSLTTRTGYQVTAILKNGNPVSLRVDAPATRYKRNLRDWISIHTRSWLRA